MPRIQMSHSHNLSMEEARKKVEKLAWKLKEQYGIMSSWSGNRLEFKRVGVKGSVSMEAGRVSLEVELSILLAALKTKVEQKLREGLKEEFG